MARTREEEGLCRRTCPLHTTHLALPIGRGQRGGQDAACTNWPKPEDACTNWPKPEDALGALTNQPRPEGERRMQLAGTATLDALLSACSIRGGKPQIPSQDIE